MGEVRERQGPRMLLVVLVDCPCQDRELGRGAGVGVSSAQFKCGSGVGGALW